MIKSAAEMESTLRGQLDRLVHALAENKKILGRRYSEWAVGAPTLESAAALSAMAQDELGHARVLYGLLEELRGYPATGDADWSLVGFAMSPLETPFDEWYQVIGVIVFLDQALTTLIESMAHSAFVPLRRRTRKMLEEERYHAIYGYQWLTRLARLVSLKPSLQTWARTLIMQAIAWFGPPKDLRPLVEADVLETDADTLRQRYWEHIGEAVRLLGIEPSHIPVAWERWDPEHRRLQTNP